MSNDLEVMGTDIAPYQESMPVLAPLSPDNDWAHADSGQIKSVDQLVYERDHHPDKQITLFGAALPFGTSQHQLDVVLGQLARSFQTDFKALGYPDKLISAAAYFLRENATKTPYDVVPKHGFNLHGNDDWLGNLFANHLEALSGYSKRQKQQFLTACLQYLVKVNQQLASQQVGTQPPRMATPTSDPTANLTDAEFERVVKINDAAKAQTYGYLESLWGQSFKSNLRMVDAYYAALPRHEQAALDVFTTGWVKALNTKEIILGLYKQALQESGGPLPSGGALAAEIAEHERAMRNDRKSWLKNEVRQSRYRELLTLRDGH